jgi:hypothetical protein
VLGGGLPYALSELRAVNRLKACEEPGRWGRIKAGGTTKHDRRQRGVLGSIGRVRTPERLRPCRDRTDRSRNSRNTRSSPPAVLDAHVELRRRHRDVRQDHTVAGTVLRVWIGVESDRCQVARDGRGVVHRRFTVGSNGSDRGLHAVRGGFIGPRLPLRRRTGVVGGLLHQQRSGAERRMSSVAAIWANERAGQRARAMASGRWTRRRVERAHMTQSFHSGRTSACGASSHGRRRPRDSFAALRSEPSSTELRG